MSSPHSKSAPIATGLKPKGSSRTSKHSPSNLSPSPGSVTGRSPARTPRANDSALPAVIDPRQASHKVRKVVRKKPAKGGKGASGPVMDIGDADLSAEDGYGESDSDESDSDAAITPPATLQVPIKDMIEAAAKKAEVEPVKLSSGYEFITSPAAKPIIPMDTTQGQVPLRGMLARHTSTKSTSSVISGFTDESEWEVGGFEMDGLNSPEKLALKEEKVGYADVLKRSA